MDKAGFDWSFHERILRMRALRLVWFSLVLLTCIAAQDPKRLAAQGKSTPESARLLVEARTFANLHWSKILRQCPDAKIGPSYFYYFESEWWRRSNGAIVQSNRHGSQLTATDVTLFELKSVSFEIFDLGLNESDKLNGFAYKAVARALQKSYRTRRMSDNGGWDSWSDWQNGRPFGTPFEIQISKKDGKWQLDDKDFSTVEDLPEMPGCADLRGPTPTPILLRR